jgi:hypothetical protein
MDVAYASFSVQPADPSMIVPEWYLKNQMPTTISYNFGLNVTNLSDEPAVLGHLTVSAAQNYTRGSNPFLINGVTGTTGTHRGAYLDGELINVT